MILGLAIVAFGSYLIINKEDNDYDDDDYAVTRSEETTEIVATSTQNEADKPVATGTTKTEDSIEAVAVNKPEEKPTTTKPVTNPVVAQTSKTYTDEATYRKSDNLYTIDVTLEVKDDVVINADVMYGNKETGYEHPFQERFDKVYKTSVIGKKLEDINLSRVGGASLTSNAFNEAVADIIKQTKA